MMVWTIDKGCALAFKDKKAFCDFLEKNMDHYYDMQGEYYLVHDIEITI